MSQPHGVNWLSSAAQSRNGLIVIKRNPWLGVVEALVA
jgi:hypothetical protein